MTDLAKIEKSMSAFQKTCHLAYGDSAYAYLSGFYGSMLARLMTSASPEDRQWALNLMKQYTKKDGTFLKKGAK